MDGYFASGIPQTQVTITIYIIYMMSSIKIPTDGDRRFICALMMFSYSRQDKTNILKYIFCFLHLHLYLTFLVISRILSAQTVRLEVYNILSQISSSSLFSTLTNYSIKLKVISNKNSSIPHRLETRVLLIYASILK